MVLLGVLGIFILVRIVKYASRTVEDEQRKKQSASGAPAPAKGVKLGMTPVEVEAALGLPETKAELGEKLLYRFQGMTVEFHNGKVTDVR
jgi:hypothetical protein